MCNATVARSAGGDMLRTEVPVYDGDPGRARSARPGDFAPKLVIAIARLDNRRLRGAGAAENGVAGGIVTLARKPAPEGSGTP